MKRCHLRGQKNILKRQLVHVGAFNLSLILRKLLGAGTPRELKNRVGRVFSRLLRLLRGLGKAFSRIRLRSRAVGPRREPSWPFRTSDTARDFGVILPRAVKQCQVGGNFRVAQSLAGGSAIPISAGQSLPRRRCFQFLGAPSTPGNKTMARRWQPEHHETP